MITKSLNQLKLDILRNSKFSFFVASNHNYFFIKTLLKLGLISYFVELEVDNKKMYKIKLCHHKKKYLIKNLIIIKKSKSNVSSSLAALKRLSVENIYIVSSSCGITELISCVSNKSGGLLLCKIIV